MAEDAVPLGGLRIKPEVMFADIDKWLDMTTTPTAPVEPGSPLAGDARKSPDLQVAHAAYSAIVVAVDHLHSFKTSLAEAKLLHTHAPFTGLRAATEASATALWLLDPATRQERIRRRLKLARHEAWEAGNVQRLLPPAASAKVRSSSERIDEIKALAKRHGLDPSDVCGRFSYEHVVREAGEASKLGGDMAELLWRLCSGFAHARDWAALGFLDRQEVQRDKDDVVSIRLTSSLDRVLMVGQAPYLFTQRAVHLFDQRRRSPFAA